MAKRAGGDPGQGGPGPLAEYRRRRDFTRTNEPAGGSAPRPVRRTSLQFVVQKHAATHLHFDLRLELDGVMKSWAVPRGPSADPAARRLAVQVEDHPFEYNTFEGTIPRGEYGGGTVMLWDRGTYTADRAARAADAERVLREEHAAGRLSVTFYGERMRGSWALVRTGRGPKPNWLLIKHRDQHADAGRDLAAEHSTSVASGRTMSEIAAERDRTWSSRRGPLPGSAALGPLSAGNVLRPMVPTPARTLPERACACEAWRGGERVLAWVTAGACALLDERGRDRTAAFLALADGLARLAERTQSTYVLDGEVTGEGAEARLHLLDILLLGGDAVAARPWRERRLLLEDVFRRRRVPGVGIAPASEDAEAMLRRAGQERWSGIFARDPDSPYLPGKRTPAWIRLPTPAKYRQGRK